MPIVLATLSICSSMAKEAAMTPKPRMALDGGRLVNTTRASTQTLGIV